MGVPGRLQCSNVRFADKFNVPYWLGQPSDFPDLPPFFLNLRPDGSSPRRGDATVTHVNWGQSPSVVDKDDIVFGWLKPCSQWFGEDYPVQDDSPYDLPTRASGNGVRDSTYSFQPRVGWFELLALFDPLWDNVIVKPAPVVDPRTLAVFRSLQKRSWFLYGFDPSVDPALIGTKPPVPPMAYADLKKAPAGPAFTPVGAANATTRPGLFGTIPTRYHSDFYPFNVPNTPPNVTAVPWYVPAKDEDAMADIIYDALIDARLKIASIDKQGVNELIRNAKKFFNTNVKLEGATSGIPHGALYFKKIDHAAKQYSINMNIGSSRMLNVVNNFPTPGDRQLLQLSQLSNAILRNSDPAKLGRAQITQGIRFMPREVQTLFNPQYGNSRGTFLYPFALSFLIPLFVIELVQEKETKILIMMKMNGMKTSAYYFSHYVTFLCVYGVAALIFLICGAAFQLSFFIATSTSLLLLLFFLWGNVHVALAFFMSTFFKRSRLALLASFLIMISSVMISITFDTTVTDASVPSYLFLWPPFAFYRAMGVMNRASYMEGKTPYSFAMLKSGDDVYTAIVYLAIQIPVLLILAGYLNAVLPSEFGVRKAWHFPISDLFKRTKKVEAGADQSIAINPDEISLEDADVVAERARVDSNGFDPASPLVIRHMRKLYASRAGAGPKLAVKDITFAVEEGIVFGLLGPNGAGKSTLISMLTGLYESTSGTASLGGFDVQTQTSEVYKNIGICPQFNILWEYLTVEEHLFFYARLKGIAAEDEAVAVDQAIRDVELQIQRNQEVRELSGGQQRRVSIAIALLGNPKVVFMDEPTTGLDPEVRRQIWNIVERTKKDKTIVLTTHSMEEAEALCQRIGIMAKGTLRCLADSNRLKSAYGSGYRLHLNALRVNTPRACAFMESLLPEGWTQVDAFATNALYEFPAPAGSLSKLFAAVEAGKQEHGILDWGVGQTTLEEVFVRLIDENDANAD
ncbi:hypothetical protein BC831DRAFT_115788 [Entophlyctis helioformis]|nr:hypothetical protein BC831DRAFT_115788 [Entophlyctis helioformis]